MSIGVLQVSAANFRTKTVILKLVFHACRDEDLVKPLFRARSAREGEGTGTAALSRAGLTCRGWLPSTVGLPRASCPGKNRQKPTVKSKTKAGTNRYYAFLFF